MKINKLKLLSIVTSFFVVLWSNVQCMDDQRNDELARNHQTTFCPTGSLMPFAGANAPAGWLICNGQPISCVDYRNLYEVIGRIYTPGNIPEDLFCVPDLKGRVIVGVDGAASRVTSNNTLGASGGEESVILIIDQMPSHNHEIDNKNKNMCMFDYSENCDRGYLMSSNFHVSPLPGSALSTGRNQPHNNMQPYLVLNYIINTGKVGNQQIEVEAEARALRNLENRLFGNQ